MGLYGSMRTAVSGMGAQANRLGTISDNVANSNTPGYKRASADFSSLTLQGGGQEYASGNVLTNIRNEVSTQGSLISSSSNTDLAIKGDGFFLVEGADGRVFLTRAGSFHRDGSGNLVNAAGFKLLGYSAKDSTDAVTNGTAGLTAVSVGNFSSLQSNPTTSGRLFVNLPFGDAVTAPADLPSANASTAKFSGKTSLLTYDKVGNPVTLDVYFAKKASGEWEVAVYNRADADATSKGFPYSSPALATTTLSFDASGKFTSTSPKSLTLTIPNGEALTLDLSSSTQLASPYTPFDAKTNGNGPSEVDRIDIDPKGSVYAIYKNGERVEAFKIPFAKVPSPDNLTPHSGNVFSVSSTSGEMLIGRPNVGGFGGLLSGTLEQSTVDLGSELTNMIEAQRNYTANSKVFQTGSELLDVLVNLKR